LDLAVFSDNDLLLSGGFGGSFSFWTFSIKTRSWSLIHSNHSIPPLIGHKLFRIGDGSGLIVGGHLPDGRGNTKVIWFTGNGKSVSFLQSQGMPPDCPIWSSIGRLGNLLFLIGGQRDPTDIVFDLGAKKWVVPQNSGFKGPIPSFYEAAYWVAGGTLWIHGGFSETDDVHPNGFQIGLEPCSGSGPFNTRDVTDDELAMQGLNNGGTMTDEPWVLK
jgi:hypothetical protein